MKREEYFELSFLDRLEPDHREQLIRAGSVEEIAPGDYLTHRGDEGGDVFLVESGTFDVVDTRSMPEVVLQVAGTGSVLGELGFIDGAVRTADLRCSSAARVRIWRKATLDQALRTSVELERSFYRALAEVTTGRLRTMVNHSSLEAKLLLGEGVAAHRAAQAVASEVLGVWAEVEERLRKVEKKNEDQTVEEWQEERRRTNEEAVSTIDRAMEKLQSRARHWLGAIPNVDERYRAGDTLQKILRPFLRQAHIGEYALRNPDLDRGRRVPMAHIIRGEKSGQGILGAHLDGFLLDLPTSRAMGLHFRSLCREVEKSVPSDRPAKVTVIGVGCGALVSDLTIRLGRRGATLRLVDGDTEVLESVDMGMSVRPSKMNLELIRIDLGLLALGRAQLPVDEQDIVIVNGLASHLPDRILAGLLRGVGEQIRGGGRLLVTGLAPSRDSVVFDHLLAWPMIRRSERQFSGLLEAEGYRVDSIELGREDDDCALFVTAVLSSSDE